MACLKDYPLKYELPEKNLKEIRSILESLRREFQIDKSVAKKYFSLATKFMAKHDNKYPCKEYLTAESILHDCLKIIGFHVPLQLVLNPTDETY